MDLELLINEKINYAEMCFKWKCYTEAANQSHEILLLVTDDKKLKYKTTLLLGKSLFYCYQRKINFLMKESSSISKEERQLLINECFDIIKNVIYYLGGALDENYIDDEGSKLLDWAMMDCMRELNKLDQCKRCFLCRRRDRRLCKSHIFPKFQLESSASDSNSKFIFGKDKEKLKSAGECHYKMCCNECETLMNQEAENEFSRTPFKGRVEYTSWLYNYCCALLFRSLAMVKLPSHLNDDEVYQALLLCRKHLLSLSKEQSCGESRCAPVEVEKRPNKVKPYLFVIPKKSLHFQEIITATLWLSRCRLVNGSIDLSGQCHFFAAISCEIIILIPFNPSSQYTLPSDCLIDPVSGTYIVPEGKEALERLPLQAFKTLDYFSEMILSESISEIIQNTSPTCTSSLIFMDNKYTIINSKKSNEESSNEKNMCAKMGRPTAIQGIINTKACLLSHPSQKFSINFLPNTYKITKNENIVLPCGHQIVFHTHNKLSESDEITVFILMDTNKLEKPYVIYLHQYGKYLQTIDGVYISDSKGEICLENFLINDLNKDQRFEINILIVTSIVSNLLHQHGFCSVEMFIRHYSIANKILEKKEITSISMKCSFDGCWYCKDLSDCCMKPARLLPPGGPSTYK